MEGALRPNDTGFCGLMLTWTSLALIDGYQRHISPRKGFCCAYRVRHGGPGCSGFAKRAIAELGLWRALPQIRQRFADCKAAALAFSAEREDDETVRAGRGKRRGSACANCAEASCYGCDPSACRGIGGGTPKSQGCDALPDCTPSCDCLPCSCGS